MKDTIISLDNGVNYYILDQLNYFGNLYVIGTLMDMVNLTVDENNLMVKRLIVEEDGGQRLESIDDPVEAQAVTELLLSKIHLGQ